MLTSPHLREHSLLFLHVLTYPGRCPPASPHATSSSLLILTACWGSPGFSSRPLPSLLKQPSSLSSLSLRYTSWAGDSDPQPALPLGSLQGHPQSESSFAYLAASQPNNISHQTRDHFLHIFRCCLYSGFSVPVFPKTVCVCVS